jgi:hypothetical protein
MKILGEYRSHSAEMPWHNSVLECVAQNDTCYKGYLKRLRTKKWISELNHGQETVFVRQI